MSYEESRRELEAYSRMESMSISGQIAAEKTVAPLQRQVDALQAALLRQAKDIKKLQAAVAKLKKKKSQKMTGWIV